MKGPSKKLDRLIQSSQLSLPNLINWKMINDQTIPEKFRTTTLIPKLLIQYFVHLIKVNFKSPFSDCSCTVAAGQTSNILQVKTGQLDDFC